MAFISNKERQETINKLQNPERGKRTWIMITLIISMCLLLFIFLLNAVALMPDQMGQAFEKLKQMIGYGEWVKDQKVSMYGWIMIGLLSTTFVLLIASFVVFCTMKSARWTYKKTIDLVSKPIAGKKGKVSKKTKKLITSRLAVDKLKKKNKK